MKNKKISVVILFIGLIIAVGVVFFITKQDKLPSNGNGISGYVIGEGIEPDLTPEQIQEMLDREVDASKISFSIYSEPIFNGKIGKIMFANPPYSAPDLTPEQIQEMLDREVDASKISFSIYSEPIFNGKIGKIMFANPPYSAHDINLTIMLDGKEIVKTGKISPNQYIEDIELLGKELKKGSYVGTAVITAYSQETGEKVGVANVEMNITVE